MRKAKMSHHAKTEKYYMKQTEKKTRIQGPT